MSTAEPARPSGLAARVKTGTSRAGLAATSRIEGRSAWALAWQRLRHDRVAIGSAVAIVLVTLLAICAPVIAKAVGHGPNQQFPATGLSIAGLPLPRVPPSCSARTTSGETCSCGWLTGRGFRSWWASPRRGWRCFWVSWSGSCPATSGARRTPSWPG